MVAHELCSLAQDAEEVTVLAACLASRIAVELLAVVVSLAKPVLGTSVCRRARVTVNVPRENFVSMVTASLAAEQTTTAKYIRSAHLTLVIVNQDLRKRHMGVKISTNASWTILVIRVPFAITPSAVFSVNVRKASSAMVLLDVQTLANAHGATSIVLNTLPATDRV